MATTGGEFLGSTQHRHDNKLTARKSDPDYVRSSYVKLGHGSHELAAHEQWIGKVTAHSSTLSDKDFTQSRDLWHIMLKQEGGRENFLLNICPHLGKASQLLVDKATGKSPALI